MAVNNYISGPSQLANYDMMQRLKHEEEMMRRQLDAMKMTNSPQVLKLSRPEFYITEEEAKRVAVTQPYQPNPVLLLL